MQDAPLHETVLLVLFTWHDHLSDWLARHIQPVKTGLLLVAHASLLGFFFPAWRNEFGEMARNVLVVILFLSPLSKIFPMRLLVLLMGFRRQLGIWFAYLATVHGLGYAIDLRLPLAFPWLWPEFLAHRKAWEPKFVLGMMAYVLTLPLVFTSNNLAVRLLKSRWKKLHRIVYAVFIVVLVHSVLALGTAWLFEEPAKTMFWGVVLLTYGLLKLLARHNFLRPLRNMIEWVSGKYAAYQAQKSAQPTVAAMPQI